MLPQKKMSGGDLVDLNPKAVAIRRPSLHSIIGPILCSQSLAKLKRYIIQLDRDSPYKEIGKLEDELNMKTAATIDVKNSSTVGRVLHFLNGK
ncbi:hypothetical protein M5K25_006522 [Dendrobium thyrsiflorum]|uniref:Uncharacterized protein n=1 Tax=Dendrobium thyrsiflorum TaxID=117978 RepID=A0ABD0VBH5_DENTH